MHALSERKPAGPNPVIFKPVPRPALEQVLHALEIDPDHLDRFLGPLHEMIAAIRAGTAHALLAIQSGPDLIGFSVLHPDRRDASCWWLGWFALDRRHQGRGFGRASMAQIMARFRRIPRCRRVRLLVDPDNAPARTLYTQAGFQPCDTAPSGELILETTLDPTGISRRNIAKPGHRSRPGRLRLLVGPYAARVIGVERGPPSQATPSN